MFRVAGVLLEADWFESLENVGNESDNLPCVNVCSCFTAVVMVLEKKSEQMLNVNSGDCGLFSSDQFSPSSLSEIHLILFIYFFY